MKSARSPKTASSKKAKRPFDIIKAVEGFSTQDLNNDDLVVFIILTQAAKMIQKAWRRFNSKKTRRSERDVIRQELLQELE